MDCFPGEPQDGQEGSSPRVRAAPEKTARFERTADMLAKSGLLEITMKTADLIRSNQQAQRELNQLKVEVDEFTKSVLANPENQGKARQQERQKFVANPLTATIDQECYAPASSPKVSVIQMAPSPMRSPRPI